jgi:hypothetical protein
LYIATMNAYRMISRTTTSRTPNAIFFLYFFPYFFKSRPLLFFLEDEQKKMTPAAPAAPAAPSHSEKLARILAVPVLEQRSPAWFEKRLTRITSSEASAVLGENPYECADDVFFRKRGLGKPFTGNVATQYGQLNEPVAIAAYCAALGRTSIDVGLIDYEAVHGPCPELCFMAGSPDGITMLSSLGIKDPEPIMLEVPLPLLYFESQ